MMLNNKLKGKSNALSPTSHFPHPKPHFAFTIVELLIVIVVIGILVAVSMVSYAGITSRATLATLQSDLTNAKKVLANYNATYSSYPTGLDATNCPSGPTTDSSMCLKPSALVQPTATNHHLRHLQ